MNPVEPTLHDIPKAAPAARRKRWGRRILVAMGLFVIALGIAAALLYQPAIRYFIQREADRLGLVVQFESAELEPGSVILRNARVSLAGVPHLSARLKTVRLILEGFSPRKVSARGATIEASGSAGDMLLALGEWSSAHPATYRIPGTCAEVQVTWTDTRGRPPWLTVLDGRIESSGAGGTFRAAKALVEGVQTGMVGAAWSADAVAVSIGIGKDSLEHALIRADIRPTDTPPTATVTVRPVKLADLGSPMGVALPVPNAVVEGNAQFRLAQRAGKEVVQGTVAMSITGWTPPHPKELDGIVFGNRTTFTTNLQISPDRRKVTLADATVTAGAFKLKGAGSIDRVADHAVVRMDLSGSVRCVDVAQSAASSHWGNLLGQIAGDVARMTMAGSVAVSVRIEADTRDLKAARLQQSVGVGCGLRLP